MSRALGVVGILLLMGASFAAGGLVDGHRDRAAADTLRAELDRNADSARAWAIARAALLADLAGLREDSAALEGRRRYAVARAVEAHDSLGKLLGLIADTTARRAAGDAVRTIAEAGERCDASLTNCEKRAAKAEQLAAGEGRRALEEARLRARADSAWQAETRRADRGERRCGIGGAAIYGLRGFDLGVGVTCTGLRLFRLPKLF